MICAALQAPQPPARTSTRTPTRTSTRTSFSQGRPLHRKWRAHHFASCAYHFAWSRTPFSPAAQAILLGGAHPFCLLPFAGSIATAEPVSGEGRLAARKQAGASRAAMVACLRRAMTPWLIVVAPRGQALVAAGRMAQRTGCQTWSHGDKPRGDIRNFRNAPGRFAVLSVKPFGARIYRNAPFPFKEANGLFP